MKTIFKLLVLPVLLVAVSCSVESVADTNEDLNPVTLQGKRKGQCDLMKERPSRNTYIGGENNTYSGTWGYPVGEFTGVSVITSFVDNLDGTFTQTSDDIVIAEGGAELWTESVVLIVPESETSGTYTANFIVTGGTDRFENATGSFRIKNGVYNETGAFHNAIGKITSKGLCED